MQRSHCNPPNTGPKLTKKGQSGHGMAHGYSAETWQKRGNFGEFGAEAWAQQQKRAISYKTIRHGDPCTAPL
jgi:hypothetical protein